MSRPLLLPLLTVAATSIPGSWVAASQEAPAAGCLLPKARLAAPPDSERYAIVQGTVRLARTNRPLVGVLLAIASCSFGTLGAIGFAFTADSTRTDAQGHYELHFRPQQEGGIGYVVRFDPMMWRIGRPSRFVFSTNAEMFGPDRMPNSRIIQPDTVTTADFAPDFAPNYSRPSELHLPSVGH